MVKEEPKQKQINLRVKDEDQFYANEISLNFNPNEIVIDFKCLTHIHDIGDHRSMILRHLPVIISPFHAKSFLSMLTNMVKDYESKFGEIKKPEALKKAEKMIKKEQKASIDIPTSEPIGNYFG